MSGASDKSNATADVPGQVFQKFLDSVLAGGGNEEMVNRLKLSLLEKHNFSQQALESAIFGENSDND